MHSKHSHPLSILQLVIAVGNGSCAFERASVQQMASLFAGIQVGQEPFPGRVRAGGFVLPLKVVPCLVLQLNLDEMRMSRMTRVTLMTREESQR